MYFSLVVCNESLYQEAKWFFLSQWRSDLLSRESSSLIWAYLVTQYMWKQWKNYFSFSEWVFSCEELFFSTSHSWDLLVLAIDTRKLAVDVEYIHPRDESLLHNVHIPDSPFNPRENFYLQWCGKECLVKYLDLKNEEMDEMTITWFLRNKHFTVNDWSFDSILMIYYRWKEYFVHINLKDGKVLALLQEEARQYRSL